MKGFQDYKYEVDLRDQRSLDGFSAAGAISDGCLVFVYDAGTKTLSTLYGDSVRTAKSNPISRSQYATDGKIVFYSPATSHDIFVAHSDGSICRYAGVTPETHVLVLNRDGVQKCLVVAFGASDNTEVDTGLDFPIDVLINDVELQVATADPTETLDIGLLSSETAGDADGLLVQASVGTAGWVRPWATTVGTNETYISAVRWGALMGKGALGSDVNNDFGQPGGVGHIVTGSNAKSLTYTGSVGSDTAAGYVFCFFRHLR